MAKAKKKRDTRTKAEKQQARAAWARKRAESLRKLSEAKRKYGGEAYDPVGAVITDEEVVRFCQNLLVNDDRAVSRQAEEMELSPGTVQRMRFGETRRATFRTVARIMAAKGVALMGESLKPRRKR